MKAGGGSDEAVAAATPVLANAKGEVQGVRGRVKSFVAQAADSSWSRKAAKLSQRDKVRAEAAEYKRIYDQRRAEAAALRKSEIAKRRSSRRSSRKAESA